jgi:predicted RNase H-like HicB family nuclease
MINTEKTETSIDSLGQVQWTNYAPQTCFECRVALMPESEGGFSVYAINLPGIASEGETESEALSNVIEALSGALAEYKADGEIPWSDDFIEEGAIERRVLVNLMEHPVAG